MATVQSQLRLNDGMSAVLRSVTSTLDTCLRSFEEVQAASGVAMDVSAITEARAELLSANNTIEQIEQNSKKAEGAQHGYNRAISAGASAADNLLGKITSVVGTYLSIQKAVSFTKGNMELADTQRRQEMQLRNVAQNVGLTEEAYKSLLDTASQIQSTTMYGDEGMIGVAAELATYIQDADALALSMQTVADYAAGMSGGAALDTSQLVDYATQIGKVYMGAYDGIKKKGFELTDVQKQIMETGTDMERALVLSDVINESWEGLAEDMASLPSGKIQQMANLWGDFREQIGNFQYPAVLRFFEIIQQNMPQIQAMVQNFAVAINFVVALVGQFLEGVVAVYSFVSENWSLLGPIVFGLAAALVALNAAKVVYNTITAITNGLEAVHAARLAMTTIAEGAETTATFAATAAQYGFNAALLACPIVWILLIIIAIIAAIYGVVAVINKLTGSTISATGVICGAFMVAFAFIGNILIAAWNLVVDVFVLIYNLVAEVANFIGNVFVDPIGAICRLFFGLADTVLGILQALASAIDAIFGSNLAGAVQGWRDSLGGWVDDTFGQGEEVMAKINADDLKLGRLEYGAAWDLGYNAGADFEAGIGDMFNFDPSSLTGDLGFDPSGYQPALDGINDNTGSAAASLKNMSEDVAYMRDIAEREAINRFTTAELHVDMTGMNNRFENDMDVDGVINRFVTGVTEALDVVSEGVHS